MKIILKEDVTNLGYKDDVVEVKDGYGRNFLIPTGKAVCSHGLCYILTSIGYSKGQSCFGNLVLHNKIRKGG